MKILVIGSEGFIGRNLTQALLNTEHEVIVCNRSKSSLGQVRSCSPDQLASLDSNIDLIFLLAAHIPYENLNVYSDQMLESNVELVLKIKSYFPKSRIVYASSVSVYGLPTKDIIDENHPFNNPSAYGQSKLAAEFIVKTFEDHIILRFSSVFGEGMTLKTFIPRIVVDALLSAKIKIFGDGSRRQNYIAIDDLVQMMLEAGFSKETGVYNVVGARSYSNLEIANFVKDYLNEVSIEFCKEDCSPSFEYSLDLWKSKFKYVPQEDISKDINKVIDYVRKQV